LDNYHFEIAKKKPKRVMGKLFDIKGFHKYILDAVICRSFVLEQRVRTWIDKEKKDSYL